MPRTDTGHQRAVEHDIDDPALAAHVEATDSATDYLNAYNLTRLDAVHRRVDVVGLAGQPLAIDEDLRAGVAEAALVLAILIEYFLQTGDAFKLVTGGDDVVRREVVGRVHHAVAAIGHTDADAVGNLRDGLLGQSRSKDQRHQ